MYHSYRGSGPDIVPKKKKKIEISFEKWIFWNESLFKKKKKNQFT